MNRVPLPERLLAVFEHRGDRSRVPNGKALAYIWQFVPYRVDGEAPETWDERRQAVGDAMVDRFLSFTNNLSEDDILGRCYMSPMDYERHNQAMYNGSVMGPLAAMHQYLAYRPVPELGQYRTPVGGLYLSGQSMHPGGGLTMGGRATAQAVMADLGIDFEEKF
jgi:phytoene dehydrogenase-like protein